MKRTLIRNTKSGVTKSTKLITPEKLISLLPPMKRILCICPVVQSSAVVPHDTAEENDLNDNGTQNEVKNKNFSISMAISDPYLANAIPIQIKRDHWTYKSFNILKEHRYDDRMSIKRGKDNLPTIWPSSSYVPQNKTEFLLKIGQEEGEYNDIGAIIFGLPIRFGDGGDEDNVNMKKLRDSLWSTIDKLQIHDNLNGNITDNFSSFMSPFGLQCYVEDQLTIDEAMKMANEEPEMWEEIDLYCFVNNDPTIEGDESKSISTNAAAVLNAFLWKHTGGWRNTFA